MGGGVAGEKILKEKITLKNGVKRLKMSEIHNNTPVCMKKEDKVCVVFFAHLYFLCVSEKISYLCT